MDIGEMSWEFPGELIEWRGPSPYHYVEVPEEISEAIGSLASLLTYGWGVIPVRVHLGANDWTTSLFPRDGLYLVPIKDAIRKAEALSIGDIVTLELTIRP